MAEDLAIDVGIPTKTDEFHTFVSCVKNILDHGCSYSSDVTEQICERCEMSQLPIAKEVLRKCRPKTSNIRHSSQKWWQTWRSKRKYTDVPRWPESDVEFKGKRPMSPMFKGKRPMSPMFKGRDHHDRDHHDRNNRNRNNRDRDHRDGGYNCDRNNRNRNNRDRNNRDGGYNRDGGFKRYNEISEPEVSYERKSKKRRRYR